MKTHLLVLFLLPFALHAADASKSAVATKPYPLAVCIVTDNDLGSMGDEKVIVHEGREIKFCCAPCERKFLKNPAKYLTKLTPAEPGKEPTKAAPETHDSPKTTP